MFNIIKAELRKIFKRKGLIVFWIISLAISYLCIKASKTDIVAGYGDLFSKYYGLVPFMGIIMFWMYSGSYILEYNSNMEKIIKTTKTERKIVFAKSIAYGIASSITNLSILVVVTLKVLFINNFQGINLHLYKIWYFHDTTANLTVLSMILIYIVTVIIGSFLFAQLGNCLSSLSKNAFVPFIIGGIIMAVPYTLCNFIKSNVWGYLPIWGMYSGEIVGHNISIVSAILSFIITSIVLGYFLYRITENRFLKER